MVNSDLTPEDSCYYCELPFKDGEKRRQILIRDGNDVQPDINAEFHAESAVCHFRLRDRIAELERALERTEKHWREEVETYKRTSQPPKEHRPSIMAVVDKWQDIANALGDDSRCCRIVRRDAINECLADIRRASDEPNDSRSTCPHVWQVVDSAGQQFCMHCNCKRPAPETDTRNCTECGRSGPDDHCHNPHGICVHHGGRLDTETGEGND